MTINSGNWVVLLLHLIGRSVTRHCSFWKIPPDTCERMRVENTNNFLVLALKTPRKEFNPLTSFPDGRFLRHKFYKEYPGKRRTVRTLRRVLKRAVGISGVKKRNPTDCSENYGLKLL